MIRSKTALYENLLQEKDRQITILVEQIEWLRAQLGAPAWHSLSAANPSSQPELTTAPALGPAAYLNEDEEDVRDMVKAGLIQESQIPDILDALGYAGTEINLA